MGLTCGEAPDGCGGVVDCGDCATGQTCGGSGPNKCGSDTCSAKTCTQLGVSCGVVSNGCGATLDCGTCDAPEVCGGGGKQNLCGCLPKTCAQLGATCGESDDGCGKKLQCGTCDDKNPCTFGDTCNNGVCEPGTPVSCSSPPNTSCYETAGTCDKATGNCDYPKRGAGAPCDLDNNACAADSCDGLGTCVATAAPPCTTPPDAWCYEAVGTCNPGDGKCVYQPKLAGTACDADGNACTTGDACDGNGLCVAGALKTCASPPNTACYNAAGTCSNVANGTQCGANVCFYCSSGACTARAVGYQYDGTESHRCCGSTRVPVDITSNETHCGGCGLGCATAETCQTVSTTSSCSSHPASTTGRCTCDSNSQCPKGRNGVNQTCRTLTPYAGVCAPSTAEYCATGESYQNLSSCPNYCYYP